MHIAVLYSYYPSFSGFIVSGPYGLEQVPVSSALIQSSKVDEPNTRSAFAAFIYKHKGFEFLDRH